MALINVNGINLDYDIFGDSRNRPLILIMGLATAAVGWPDPFCGLLAQAGHWVIRFDNRDVGGSTKLEQLGAPDMIDLMRALNKGLFTGAPYTLSDMAADTIGLMDALDISTAHVCGMSMGGMIGQIMALEYPQRVASLVSMMSTTGERDLPPATPEAFKVMLTPPPKSRSAYQDYLVGIGHVFSGGSSRFDAGVQRELAGQAFDKGLYPIGFVRQTAAILACPGRRAALNQMAVPTLVIHGTNDPVAPPEHGRDTARSIPGAQLIMVEGLGHGMAYPSLWETMSLGIMRHTADAAPVQA